MGVLVVDIVGQNTISTDYGYTTIYTFREVNTNIKYKWFSSNGELNADERYEIYTGSIKSFQKDPKFGDAIILTRCKARLPEVK